MMPRTRARRLVATVAALLTLPALTACEGAYDLTLPGAAEPAPHMRRGTPVSRSHNDSPRPSLLAMTAWLRLARAGACQATSRCARACTPPACTRPCCAPRMPVTAEASPLANHESPTARTVQPIRRFAKLTYLAYALPAGASSGGHET